MLLTDIPGVAGIVCRNGKNMKKDIKQWMIAWCCTESDGCGMARFDGTVYQLKKKLAAMIREDKRNDPDSFDYGDTKAEDVRDESNGCGLQFGAYATFHDYHIDYTAIEVSHIDSI